MLTKAMRIKNRKPCPIDPLHRRGRFREGAVTAPHLRGEEFSRCIRALFFLLVIVLCVHAPLPANAAEDTEMLDLPFKDEPVAVFTTHSTLWLVADGSLHVTPDMIQKSGSHFVTGIRKLPSATATIFSCALGGDYEASVEKSDTGLHVLLQHGTMKPLQPLHLSLVNDDAKQPSLSILTKTAKDIISFTDPDTGDTLTVIPLAETGHGFYPARAFSKFSILQSAQGVVLQTAAEDIAASLNDGNAIISSPTGLKLSPVAMETLSSTDEAASDTSSNILFPYASWKLSDNKNFVPTEMKLFHDITYGSTEAANKARLRLLDIYLSEGLFIEAAGMAGDILRSSYKFYRANKVAALRGAANFFMRRNAEAERDFASSELGDDKEVALWRNLNKEVLGEDSSRFDFAANYDAYISKYPPVFIQKLALIAADFDIKQRDYDKAQDIFGLVSKNNNDEPIAKYIEYMHAEILSETKNEEEAIKIWEKEAEMVDDPLIRASAEFSLINLEIREDKITPEKAIKELDKLRIVWRGDDLELSILTLLSSLYIDQKDYAKALYTLREVVMYYPQSQQTIATAEKMEQIFTMLYNKGGADNMPPLEALALFYEFRDLVPAGKDGDMMIRNLAERLVGIDLLDRAEMLLNHQVQKRLQGYERSRVGAHLAAIYLQNHQPKDALDTLKTTGYGDLPPDLQLQRQRLTAKALAAEGQADKAIQVLSSDNSPEGMLLRLAIYWETKDWPNVTVTAEEILSNRTDPSAPLAQEESGVLLKLATAYVYEHDSGQIQYLRDYFTPLLKDNPDKESFLFITSESGSIDYTNVANPDTDITTVKSFLDETREEAKKGEAGLK
jgi:tetratricopeptide (TPR) repeat protein